LDRKSRTTGGEINSLGMAKKRQVFYSFHYKPDSWRASQIRNIGVVKGNCLVSDNKWEKITKGGYKEIKRWIDNQMKYRSCTVVLVGSKTANRKWINYEIIKSWKDNKGVVGIRIHGLKNKERCTSSLGNNPFNHIEYKNTKLSKVVKCYNPVGSNSREKYNWIS